MESKKRKNYWAGILVLIGFVLLSRCSKDPSLPNYDKGSALSIDSAMLHFYSTKDSFLFSHPLNASGGSSNLLPLDTNREYHSELMLFSNGVAQNAYLASHSSFYLFTSSISALQSNILQINTTDVDKQKLALGLKSTWSTSTITSDSIQVEISGWYYEEAVKGSKVPTGNFFTSQLPVKLK